MAKIVNPTGKAEKFDSREIENDLENIGLPRNVAEEVAERVESRVENGWTTAQVKQQVQIELNRMDEDLKRAQITYISKMQKP